MTTTAQTAWVTPLLRGSVQHLPLADNSVDMIFTDPPYLKQFLPCYGQLAQEAARILKPGGFVRAMCGGVYLNQIFRMFDDASLTFYWDYILDMKGNETGVVWPYGNRKVNIINRAKHIIAYSKGRSLSRIGTVGKFTGESGDKRYHEWGQAVGSARYYIDCFTEPGDLVLDPFVGGGTTAAACKLIGRRCIGLDIDPVAIQTTRDRLSGLEPPEHLPLLAFSEPIGAQL